MKTIKVTVDGVLMGTFKVDSIDYAMRTWKDMYGDSVFIEVCD